MDATNDSSNTAQTGLVLNGKEIPEVVLETIFSFVDIPTIVKLRQVCRLWKDIVSRRTLWREVFKNNGASWKAVPELVKANEDIWKVSFFLLNQKRIIKNHSGLDGFNYWKRSEKAFYNIIIESPPVGIRSLPIDSFYSRMADSAFVTSFQWDELRQVVCLEEIGLTPKILQLMAPLNFYFKATVGARFDCGANFHIGLHLLDENEENVSSYKLHGVVLPDTNWQEQLGLVTLSERNAKFVKYLMIVIRGKDSRFRIGHYGAKFSRIIVTVKCMDRNLFPLKTNEEDETDDEPCKNVTEISVRMGQPLGF